MEESEEQWMFPVPVEETREFVEKHINRIATVSQLAEMMGYSRSYFSTRVKKYFGVSPSVIIRQERLEKIKRAIRAHPHETSRAIAERAGLQGGHVALYKFLNTHWNINFTELRKKVLAGDDWTP